MQISIIKVFTLLSIFIVAVQCGGSGSSAPATVSNIDLTIDTGNIKPKPKLRSKWAYTLKKFGKENRVAFEIYEINSNVWSELQMNDGIEVNRRSIFYNVINGLTHIEQQRDSNILYSFDTPGARSWLDRTELPYSEVIRMGTLSSSGIGSFYRRRDFTFVQDEVLSFPNTSTTTYQMKIIYSFSNDNTSFEVYDTRQQWINDSYGVVKEVYFENNAEVTLELVSFEENSHNDIVINGDYVSSINYPVVMSKAGLNNNIQEALLREIYHLNRNYSEVQNKQEIVVSLAQGLHLYKKLYLYPEKLPNNLSEINTLEQYIDSVNQKDQFTYYFSPEEYSTFLGSVTGETSVIGIQLSKSNGLSFSNSDIIEENQLMIKNVLPLTRGWMDGLQNNDIIHKISGNTVTGLTYEKMREKLPKNESQNVELEILRNGATIIVNTASENHISKMLSDNIMYVNIRKFTETTGSEVKKDIETLVEQNGTPEGLIIDLRYNSGGSSAGTRVLLDYLIDLDSPINENIIYSIKGSTEKFYFGNYETTNMFKLDKSKVVVLINGDSASASEITSGTLQFYGLATIIGMKSFGKGVSQTLRQFLDGSGAAITYRQLLVAGQKDYHGSGIDVDIESSTNPVSVNDDKQLTQAINFIKTGSTTKPRFKTNVKESKISYKSLITKKLLIY